MTPVTATEVVRAYDQRARFARAEADAVRRPRLLRGVLNAARRVAEIPCGAGHFVADYTRAGVEVTLVDACAAMLAAAVEHATQVGLPGDRTTPVVAYVLELDLGREMDLVVVPNAALNQLACQSQLLDLLTALRTTVAPGGNVLAQVLCTHPGGGVDTVGFYNPAWQDSVWITDRCLDPHAAGGAALRRRRQHRQGNLLRIEFDYQGPHGGHLHTTTVDLALFSAAQLSAAFTAAGFERIQFLPGLGGLSEILATASPRCPGA